ncbi:Mitochondrial 2-oxoadipate and 2-oxoglutarate transporter [Apophysomyces sp. BC1034]|nr:Mitochondrial 2-oxoadipate and 2-oxoglutarate transporter [Apophysomyces sp. BC1015]KAG0177571.1 Mitochondrial 2-oxoadipate and 2-oxoglutarate transporter [Apophysomyces sp. BC1021]KAG0187833.1 Mitochondrial 2-oxoadipate and 2-oxoglutarate transporter [Apophysomyces sp. BC1034]
MLTEIQAVSVHVQGPGYPAIDSAPFTTPSSKHQPGQENISTCTVEEVIKQKLVSLTDSQDGFFVVDLGEVYQQHCHWRSLLPRIKPFFAIKANPDPHIIKLLASLGTGFDCASQPEIENVLNCGVGPERIIYANTCKEPSHIRFAALNKVYKMTFDCVDELHKIKMYCPKAELVLRILADDSRSLHGLGIKFGAPLSDCKELLQTARDLGLNVIGVSFHVGTGCTDENAFVDAVECSKTVFDMGKSLGFNFSFLDVGGGFPTADLKVHTSFEQAAAVLGPAVDKLFPPEVEIIAEPGRFFVASAFTLCLNIIGRKAIDASENKYMYFVNDGIHGSFTNIVAKLPVLDPEVLVKKGAFLYNRKCSHPVYPATIWGPTCDSNDRLAVNVPLPLMDIGDWLVWKSMGAYTNSMSSEFNGFRNPKLLYTNTSYEKLFIS